MTTQLYNEGTYSTGTYGGLGTLPTTYDECLEAIEDASYESVKLRLISLLPSLRGDQNPNYEKGLSVIAKQTNEITRQTLIDEIYTFAKVGEVDDYEPFEYVGYGYIDKNPGIVGNMFTSYVGIYYDTDGTTNADGNESGSMISMWDDNYIWNDDDIWVES